SEIKTFQSSPLCWWLACHSFYPTRTLFTKTLATVYNRRPNTAGTQSLNGSNGGKTTTNYHNPRIHAARLRIVMATPYKRTVSMGVDLQSCIAITERTHRKTPLPQSTPAPCPTDL